MPVAAHPSPNARGTRNRQATDNESGGSDQTQNDARAETNHQSGGDRCSCAPAAPN